MNNNEFIGMLIMAVVTLGGFAGLLFKCYQPINKLNENIIKLTAEIQRLLENDQVHERRLNSHGREIDHINQTLSEQHTAIEKHELLIQQIKNNRG